MTAALPAAARGRPIEVWWQDEARVGQQGTLTRVYRKSGLRSRTQLAALVLGHGPR